MDAHVCFSDAERHGMRSHAERGNDQPLARPSVFGSSTC